MRTIFDRDDPPPADDEAPLGRPLAAHDGRCCLSIDVPTAPAAGSRRPRLWDLDPGAHCPVVGLCLPVNQLRRLMQRFVHDVPADDYELHTRGVGASRQRNAFSEALQRELDARHAQALRQAAALKTESALQDWWQAQRAGPRMPAALWSVLTHARCTPALQAQVLGEVHMQQHEVGQIARALAERQQQMQDDQARSARERAAAVARAEQAARGHAQERERLQAEAMRLRGLVMAREGRIVQLGEDLQALRAAQADLPGRQSLARRLEEQGERLRELQRTVDRLTVENSRLRAATVIVPPTTAQPDAPQPSPAPPDALRDRAVLCVGGRTGSVPVYRQLIEGAGARFLHHDGGEESSAQRLEHHLAAADLVICQTGCISHGAYWRVKEHCRRTGKRCVFVEQPSASSLQRALGRVADDPAVEPA